MYNPNTKYTTHTQSIIKRRGSLWQILSLKIGVCNEIPWGTEYIQIHGTGPVEQFLLRTSLITCWKRKPGIVFVYNEQTTNGCQGGTLKWTGLQCTHVPHLFAVMVVADAVHPQVGTHKAEDIELGELKGKAVVTISLDTYINSFGHLVCTLMKNRMIIKWHVLKHDLW